tara:strand:+ start:250 stop:1764 length:1515 start_codon:yes stop_codon:yes gene_type:complete
MSGLTDYSINETPMMMDIRSDTLEPISGVQGVSNRFVFRLDQAGYLDANSMLCFKICNANNDIRSRVNCFNGGLGAIKRITFQVGDYIINDVNGADIISTLMNLSTQNPATRNHYSGWYYGNQLWTDIKRVAGNNNNTGTFAGELGGVGSMFIDPQRSGLNDGDNNNNNAGVAINSNLIRTLEANTKQIGIPLGVILPALRGKTIPLFLFQDYRILITVEFNDGSNFVNDISQVGGTAPNLATGANAGLRSPLNATSGINFRDVKLQVDYVIMPSAIQNKDREMTNKQGGYRFDFYDVLRIEKQIPQVNANTLQNIEHRIGMDNKEVHKIYMTKQLQNIGAGAVGDAVQQNKWLGKQRIDGMNQEEYNVNIDGVDIFQDWKFSPASQYDETSNCLGGDLKLDRPFYYNDDNTIHSCLSPSVAGLIGQYKPLCLDLTNGSGQIVGGGRNIGAYPIIWKYKRKPTGNVGNKFSAINTPLNVNYYALVSKTAIITSTPKGTSILVSY